MARSNQIANYIISRRVAENVFGIPSSRFRVFYEAMFVHPDKVKDIVVAYLVLHNMLRAERGAGGRVERDLGDEEIPCELEDGFEGDCHDRNPPTVPRNRGTT